MKHNLITLVVVAIALTLAVPAVAELPSFVTEQARALEDREDFGYGHSGIWAWGEGSSENRSFHWVAHTNSEGLLMLDLSIQLSPPCTLAVARNRNDDGGDGAGNWAVRSMDFGMRIETSNDWIHGEAEDLSVEGILGDHLLRKLTALSCFDTVQLTSNVL